MAPRMPMPVRPDVPMNSDPIGDIDSGPNPNPRPIFQPTGKPIARMAGDLLQSDPVQELVGEAKGIAGDFALQKAKEALNTGRNRLKGGQSTQTQNPNPQAGGGNFNNGGSNMGKGNGGNGGGKGRGGRGGGGAGGSAFNPGTNSGGFGSGLQSGPYSAAPSGPRIYLNTPADRTLNKIASVPQQLYGSGELGKMEIQMCRTQISVINWNDCYTFNIANEGQPIEDTVNTVIQNVWEDKMSSIIQAAIAYKRGTNNDINKILTRARLTAYHNIALRGHALVAEIQARRNFMPEYEDQNQALSLIKTNLDADTELLLKLEELKFKLSNLVLPPKVMEYCCWMYQLCKNIPTDGSDLSFAASQYMMKDLMNTNTSGFPAMKAEIDQIISLITKTGTVPDTELTNVQFQIITQYLRNCGLPYQLMANHVFGHPKMDYDPVWNGTWDNICLYVNDNTVGRFNPFGEYDPSTDDLQVAFPMQPQSVPIATTAPLIMNFGKYGVNNNRNMKRSAFPYWGVSVDDGFTVANFENTSMFTLLLLDAAAKGIYVGPIRGSRSLFRPHIYNFGASDVANYEHKQQNQSQNTPVYLKTRGDNIYQYNPSISSIQDAVKRFFIQMESMESVVPVSLRD